MFRKSITEALKLLEAHLYNTYKILQKSLYAKDAPVYTLQLNCRTHNKAKKTYL